MRNKACFIAMILLGCCIASYADAYYRDTPSQPSSTQAETKQPKAYESIELIPGDTQTPYVRVGLVWKMNRKAAKAIVKLKKEAAKKGADAVIHYQVQAPTVSGVAVRWATPEEAKQAGATSVIPKPIDEGNLSI